MPVVRSISPHMGETVHDKSRVQRPHVANEARVKAYEPRLVPCEDRHQYRHREAQREHNDLVIPGTIRANVKEKSCSSRGGEFFKQLVMLSVREGSKFKKKFMKIGVNGKSGDFCFLRRLTCRRILSRDRPRCRSCRFYYRTPSLPGPV